MATTTTTNNDQYQHGEDYEEYCKAYAESRTLIWAEEIPEIARQLTSQMEEDVKSDPIVLPVMNGGMRLCADMLSNTSNVCPILDSIRTRAYEDFSATEAVEIVSRPSISLWDKDVVFVDDLIDSGMTLKRLTSWARGKGAARIYWYALGIKEHKKIDVYDYANYIGITVRCARDFPDLWVFGYGMDYKGYGRNLDAVYGVEVPTTEPS